MGHRGFFHPFSLIVVIAAGLGMGPSGAVVSAATKHVPMMELVTIGRIAFGVGLIGVAMAHHLLFFALSLGLVLFGQNLAGTVLMTWRTQHTPLELQGRISGSIAQMSSLASWIGVLVISGLGAIFHSTALPFMLAGGVASYVELHITHQAPHVFGYQRQLARTPSHRPRRGLSINWTYPHQNWPKNSGSVEQ